MDKIKDECKDDYEAINGPEVVGHILARMGSERRHRILDAIKNKSPEIFSKLGAETNILSFDELSNFTDKSLQVLIKEVEHYDLVKALKGSNEETRVAIMRNISERKGAALVEDYKNLAASLSEQEVKLAQTRILDRAEELRTQGLLIRVCSA